MVDIVTAGVLTTELYLDRLSPAVWCDLSITIMLLYVLLILTVFQTTLANGGKSKHILKNDHKMCVKMG